MLDRRVGFFPSLRIGASLLATESRKRITDLAATIALMLVTVAVPSIHASDDPPGTPKAQPAIGTVGQLKRVDTKDSGSLPFHTLTVGPLVFRESDSQQWQAAEFKDAVAHFPAAKSNYAVANFSGSPKENSDLAALIKRLNVEVVHRMPNGLIVNTDRPGAIRIAEMRDAGDKVVDFVAPITPDDKLSDPLKKRLAALDAKSAPTVPRVPAPPAGAAEQDRIRKMLRRQTHEVAGFRPSSKADLPAVPRPPANPEQANVAFYLFPESSNAPTIQKIKEVGGTVVSQGKSATTSVVRAQLPLVRVRDVAGVPAVRHVIVDAPHVLRNDVAIKIMTSEVSPLSSNPYTLPLQGDGQVVGHADEGLDVGRNDATLHEAFRGRLMMSFALGRTGEWSDLGGHGTHTAGSILGGARFAGLASKATLIHQSVGDASGNLTGLPSPLDNLFEQAYNQGARIHSDSWGVQILAHPDLAGEYRDGYDVDSWCWNNGVGLRDMLIVIAAGNDGTLTPAPIGVGTIGAPATAKDCLAVGASDTVRPSEGALSIDMKQLAPFSSYGPAKHGRLRPDVVAPGTWIVSPKTRGERITWSDDVEATSGWQADRPYSLTQHDAIAGVSSWRLQRAAGEVFQDFLISPPIACPSGPPLTIEVWLRGTIAPAKSFLIAVQPGAEDPEPLEGDTLLGARTFNRWTVVSGRIPKKLLGRTDVRLLFVAMQDTPSAGPIDLFIDRVRVTTFESWGALSADAGLACPLDNTDRAYTFMGGTSMATPLVAGAATLVREFLIKKGTARPSAALVKGVLINTATPHSGPRPNFRAGWGLINVRRALQSTYLFDDASSLRNGRTATYTFKVTRPAELRTTLLWTDPPEERLVNNLDLTLIAPSGREIPAEDPFGNRPDTVNNVENIDVGKPELGEWTVRVKASTIKLPANDGTQPFVVIVSGPIQ